MIWPIKRLDTVADLCLGKMLDQNKNKGEPRPYLANINVRWGSFELDDLREMRFQESELDRYGLKSGDIVMCEGGEPGRCALWRDEKPGMMLQKALHRIRVRDGLDSQFLLYALLHLGKTNAMEAFFTGATIKHLPGEQLAKLEVPVPPVETQRRIASILGAYDDLIEVNRRRVKLLEEMARGLFEEWFVRFRFTGHETVPLLDTPNGKLPKGWKVVPFGGISENFDRYRKPLSGQVRQGMQGRYPYYGAAKIFDHIDNFIFEGLHLLVAEDGSVITSDGYPMLQLVDGKFWVNNHAHVIKGRGKVSTEFLYLALMRQPIQGYITGAAQPKITQANLNRIPVVIPSEDVIERFNIFASKVLALALSLNFANERLAASRDLLLPRLLSGQLSVEATEPMLAAAD